MGGIGFDGGFTKKFIEWRASPMPSSHYGKPWVKGAKPPYLSKYKTIITVTLA